MPSNELDRGRNFKKLWAKIHVNRLQRMEIDHTHTHTQLNIFFRHPYLIGYRSLPSLIQNVFL